MPIPALEAEELDRVLADQDTVFIAYWREGCQACKAFEPILEAAASAHRELAFYRVNTLEQKALMETFDVAHVPCLVVIRQSVMIASQPGFLPAEVLEDLIGKVGALDMDALKREMQAAQAVEEDVDG